jgi:DNA-binding Xre family transcriptional regulator
MTINQTNEIGSKLLANTASSTNQDGLHKKIPAQNASSYLNLITIQKMLNKLLTEKNMSKESLTEALGLKRNELEAIINHHASSELVAKVNLPLIKLFCETKFNN